MNIQRIQAAMIKQATVRRNVNNSQFVTTGSNGQVRSVTAGTPTGAPPRNMRRTPTSVVARGGATQQPQQTAPAAQPAPQPAPPPVMPQPQPPVQQPQWTPEQIQYMQQQRMMQMQRLIAAQRQWAMQQAAMRGYNNPAVQQNTYGSVSSTRGYGPNGQLVSFTAGNVR